MAQYLISHVRQVNGVIEFVRAGVLATPAGGSPSVNGIQNYRREEVVNWIRQGNPVNTSLIYRDSSGIERWPTNAKVQLTRDGRHITTDPNHTTSDNLENLPTF